MTDTTDATDPFVVPTDDIRPSQLYLNDGKLAAVAARFDFDDPDYDALPARELDGEWVLTDGHTERSVPRWPAPTNDDSTRTPTTCR